MIWKKVLVGALVVAVGLYLLAIVLLYIFQQRLIYPGWWAGTPRVQVDLSGYRDVELTTSDGLRGHLLYHPPAPGKPVILFFHGNGDNVSGGAVAVERLVAQGYGAVLPEYRGYGGNPGVPTEQGLYSDARAARMWMAANGIPADHIVIIGYSLGSGVAAQMALEMKPRALVLVAPYASIAHVAQASTPWVPVSLLLTERFDTLSKIRRIDCPILLIHGLDDRTIPAANSALLKEAQPAADRVTFPAMGHEVMFTDTAQARIAAWLKEKGS